MVNNEIRARTVYCLTKRVPDENYDVYVGSTSLSIEERLRKQKSLAKQENRKKAKVFRRMNEVGLENWMIVPLLTLDCTKEEIRSFERKWFELLEADLNTNSPFTSKEEAREKQKAYHEANREKIIEKQKAYEAANREKIRESQKEYEAANLEKRKAYYEANREKIRERQKEYHEANREKILERKRAYNAVNREKIREKQKAYNAANQEKIREKQKAYHEANREKIHERKRANYAVKKEESQGGKEC